ncbi:MAG: ATP-binding protein [Nitrospirota bacterium]|jgi:PAS domain S-box-containing protein
MGAKPLTEVARLRARVAELESLTAGLREAAAPLRYSEERFRTICEHAPVMIDSFDESGRCTLWNRQCERILGWTRADIVELEDPMSVFYPDPDEHDRVLDAIQHADGRFREYRVLAKDGSTRIQLWANFRTPAGVRISVGHDVTEERRIEEELRQAQKMEALGQLAGGIAHDFNNILTVILTNANLIARKLPKDQPLISQLTEQIEASARHGADLVRRLLDYSRVEMMSVSPVDLNGMLDELVPTLRRLLPENIEVGCVTDTALPPMRADRGAVERILLNLATNARDAMPHGGILQIATRCTRRDGREYVVLSVRDEGTGMDARTRDRVFEPFFTTKQGSGGTGLGLTMVYCVMQQQGGLVEVTSEVGRGTTVDTFFACAAATEAERPERSARPKPTAATILLVEDEATIRMATALTLREDGYAVLEAADGEEALRIARTRRNEIDLVISDVVMPRLGGPDLYRALSEEGLNLRFLFITGYAANGAADRLERAVPVLYKPWTASELADRVAELLVDDHVNEA